MTFIRLEELIDTFNDEGISNYLVAFMRLLTSKQMKKEADIYINYIDEQVDVAEFCALEVEPMFKESDFVHIHALSKVLKSFVKTSEIANFQNYVFVSGHECDCTNRIP